MGGSVDLLEVKAHPDPRSDIADRRADEGEAVPIIESEALGILRREMERYAHGEVPGRSFLISGHRGSGKTTLVHAAIQRIKEARARGGYAGRPESVWRRPLCVPLHGPNLTPLPKDRPPTARMSLDRFRRKTALVEITRGLHRAYVGEITRRFRERVLDEQRSGEQLELPAQLEIELDLNPTPARLHALWRAGNFTREGVLFRPDRARDRPPDQSFRELVALSSVCEANLRTKDVFFDLERERLGELSKQEVASAGDREKKGLWGMATTLLSGSLVGAGSLAAQAQPVVALVIALVTAVSAAGIFRLVAHRNRKLTSASYYTFLPDVSVESLDSVLPVLLDRIRDAGLAPIFLVDELDKLDESIDVGSIVRHLKKFVTEDAFFCFLTDRTYFEHLRVNDLEDPHSLESTYFTHQLFITFDAPHLRNYVGAHVKPDDNDVGSLPAEFKAARLLLPYVVAHRAQLHAINVHRELARLRESGDDLAENVFSLPSYLLDALVQLAIERVITDSDLRGAMRRDPDFRRMVYDALYFPTREWNRGARVLDLRDEATFNAYLDRRATSGGRRSDAAPNQRKPAISLGREERRLLLDATRKVASLLADPDAIKSELELKDDNGNKKNAAATEAVHQMDRFLRPVPEEPFRYEWEYRLSGVRIEHPESDPLPKLPWQTTADFLDRVERFFDKLGLSLATLARRYLLRASPAWPAVRKAIDRLTSGESEGDDHLLDVQLVKKYATMLSESAPRLAHGLVAGAYLSRARAKRVKKNTALKRGLTTLATELDLSELDLNEAVRVLDDLVRTLRASKKGLDLPALSAETVGTWFDQLQHEVDDGRSKTLPDRAGLAKAGWERWRARVDEAGSGWLQRYEPAPLDLRCGAGDLGPGRYLQTNLPEMTFRKWTTLMEVALRGAVPAWAGTMARLALQLPLEKPQPHVPSPAAPVGRCAVLVYGALSARFGSWTPSPKEVARANGTMLMITANELQKRHVRAFLRNAPFSCAFVLDGLPQRADVVAVLDSIRALGRAKGVAALGNRVAGVDPSIVPMPLPRNFAELWRMIDAEPDLIG